MIRTWIPSVRETRHRKRRKGGTPHSPIKRDETRRKRWTWSAFPSLFFPSTFKTTTATLFFLHLFLPQLLSLSALLRNLCYSLQTYSSQREMGLKKAITSSLEDVIEKAGGCAVVDGGFATQLERHGAAINDPLWSAVCLIKQPDLIKRVCVCVSLSITIFFTVWLDLSI